MVEFDMYGNKLTGKDALIQKIWNAVAPMDGEIAWRNDLTPDVSFSYDSSSLVPAIKATLKRLGLNSSISVNKGRIYLVDIDVELPFDLR